MRATHINILFETAAERMAAVSNISLPTTIFLFFEIAEHLKTVLRVFAHAALLKDCFTSLFDVLSRYFKSKAVFELGNAEIATFVFHYHNPLS